MDNEAKYRVQALILDWAGTTIDFGCCAPAEVFVEVFRRRGIEISAAEARGPMGRAKHDHFAAIVLLPRVAALWEQVHGKPLVDADVQSMYDEFLPLQKQTLSRHCDLIPGTLETIADCRRQGIRIGSTTGYTRDLMEIVCPLAAASGYAPEVVICAGETAAGRPAPWMIFRAAEELNVYPMRSVVVVDDTPVGIKAGRHAGAWTVAVTRTGNEFGLTRQELAALSSGDVERIEQRAKARLSAAGAHFMIDGIDALPPVLDQINLLLSAGNSP